jgi:hypothetical protein
MIQPKIQQVYIAVNKKTNMILTDDSWNNYIEDLEQKTLVTFTSEEFETFKREFGGKLLEQAADNAETDCEFESHTVDKESITSVLDDFLKENKI